MKKLSMFVLALIAGVLTSVAQWGNNAEESVAIAPFLYLSIIAI